MAVDVLTATTIARPPGDVAAWAADPGNAPRWYANIESAEWLTEPPLRVGSRIAFTASFLRRRLAYTYEVAVNEPGRRVVMATAEGPFPMETTYTWEPDGADGTRMTLRNRGRPEGFSRLAAPLMAFFVRRANRRDLARLKEILESGG